MFVDSIQIYVLLAIFFKCHLKKFKLQFVHTMMMGITQMKNNI